MGYTRMGDLAIGDTEVLILATVGSVMGGGGVPVRSGFIGSGSVAEIECLRLD